MLTRVLLILFILLMLPSQHVSLASTNASTRSHSHSVKHSKQNIISKQTAISIANSEVRGKVLSAKLIRSKGPAVYRIKMLVGKSRIRTIFVDGSSATVIRIN